MNEKEIKFNPPIEWEKKQYPALTMREPLVKDQIHAEEIGNRSSARAEIALIAALCGQPIEMVMELTLAQYGRLSEALSGFLKSTGRESA